jgi:hypothetical protein
MYPPKEERSLSDWNMFSCSAVEIVITCVVVQGIDRPSADEWWNITQPST